MINTKRSLRFLVLALAMAALMFFNVPLRAAAEAVPVYLKDVVISSGSTASEAKRWLTEHGYSVVDADLNEGTGFSYVYLGYKTTMKKEEALTDLSILDMNGGYSMIDYAAFAEQNSANIAVMTDRLADAAREMRQNLQDGSRAAEAALRYLNIFTVPEASAKLGDWLLDARRTPADYRRLLLIANSLVINVVYSYLSLGCCTDTSFAQILSDKGPDAAPRPLYSGDEDAEEYWNAKENADYSRARELYRTIAAFTSEYDRAEAARRSGDGSIEMKDVSEESADTALRRFAQSGQVQNESDEDAFILSAYAYLQQFPYISRETGTTGSRLPKSTTLGDFFLEIGHGTDSDEQISMLYPFAESLTDGQFAMLTVQGLTTFVSYSAMDAAALDTLDGLRDHYRENLQNAVHAEEISVWIGANTDLFDSKIALTEHALRQAAAANDLGSLTNVSEFDVDIRVALCYVGGAAAASAGVTLLAVGMGSFVFHGVTATISAGLMTLSGTIATTVSGVVFGVIGAIGLAVTAIALAALLIVAIVFLVHYVSDAIDYFFPDYTEIPKILIEKSKGGYLEYHAVAEREGSPADLNGWKGSKWNALYYTRDPRAGNPITADPDGNLFAVRKGSYQTPSGYLPVSRMGENTAYNLNTDTYLDLCSGIYLYYCADPSESASGQGRYLEELVMYSDKNPKAVKDRLIIEGYSILDFNLTSDSGYATYIGYRTTDLEREAIRDIRVSWASGGATGYWGAVSETYGLAGCTSRTITEDETDIHISLYYSKGASFGTPVLSEDFGVVRKLSEIPDGCEGVNLFSGGRAFDFNTYDKEDEDDWNRHTYVYFRPSVSYTSGTEYVSGILFVSGSTDMKPSNVREFVDEMELTVLSDRICSGFLDDEDRTYLCISKTYNPYRAITDIGVFTGEFHTKGFPDNVVLDGVGYMSSQVFTQGDRHYYGNILWGGYYRLIRPDHAYITSEEDYGGDDSYGDSLVTRRAMYVAGPAAGKAPITVEELICSASGAVPDGYVGVREMSDVYGAEALNLAMYDSTHKNAVYLCYPGTQKQRETYISGIQVVYSEEEDASYNACLLSLMAGGGGEFLKTNLAQPDIRDCWTWGTGAVANDQDSDWDDYEDGCAYLRVTRTKTKNDAIGTIMLYRVNENSPKPEKTLKLTYDAQGNTATFVCAGDRIRYGDSYYYLYYSKTGNKITSLTVDALPFTTGAVTALDQNRRMPTDFGYYFKTQTNTSLPYIANVLVAAEKIGDDQKAVNTLLAAGCTEIEPYPASNYGGKRCVYIGYSRTTSASKALKNIVICAGDVTGDDRIEIGGVAYTRCGADLNSGLSSAPHVFLYATNAGDSGKALTDFAVGSRVPSDEIFGKDILWEYARTSEGERANMTEGLFETVKGGCGEDDTTTHTAYYLYLHHKDNTCYSDDGMAASVFAENATVFSVIALSALPLITGAVVLLVRRKKRKAA